MAQNAFAAEWKKEEKATSASLSKTLTKSMASAAVQKEVDKATKVPAKGSRPEKAVIKAYEKMLAISLKLVAKDYAGMTVNPVLSYKAEGGKWRATVTVTATYNKEKIGAAKYMVRKGDTLFKICEKYYGSGAYYPEVVAANPKMAKLKGNFIVAGVPINLPALEVLDPKANSKIMGGSSRAAGTSKLQAKDVAHPWANYNLSQAKPLTQVYSTPAVVIEVTVTLKGSISGSKGGPITMNYSEKGFKADFAAVVSKALGKSTLSIDGKAASVSLSTPLIKDLGSVSWKITKDLRGVGSISFTTVDTTIDGYKVKGKVGADVSVRFFPNMRQNPMHSQGYRPQEYIYRELTLGEKIMIGLPIVVVSAAMITIVAGPPLAAGAIGFKEALTAGAVTTGGAMVLGT